LFSPEHPLLSELASRKHVSLLVKPHSILPAE